MDAKVQFLKSVNIDSASWSCQKHEGLIWFTLFGDSLKLYNFGRTQVKITFTLASSPNLGSWDTYSCLLGHS